MPHSKSATCLFNIIQKSKEPLREYIRRFNMERLQIPDLDSSVQLIAAKKGVRHKRLKWELELHPLATMEKFLTIAHEYIRTKEAVGGETQITGKRDDAAGSSSSSDLATPFAFGSRRHVNPERASNPGLIYDLGTADYLNYLCIQELDTDIYVFRTRDGSGRIKLVEHGGWPCWLDDFTLYFHRKSDDGWWSVYRAILPRQRTIPSIRAGSVVVERVTPPGVHAFTPAASPGNKSFIALATRRPTSDFRHIELLDLVRNEFREVTRPVSPQAHHFNPFLSYDSTRVGYHRCRGSNNGGTRSPLLLENLPSPAPEISLFRIDGSFPSFSPDGNRIAYAGFPGVYVVNRDGSGKREVFPGTAFATAWDWKRKGVIYTSAGPTFAEESTEVDVISITVDGDEMGQYKKLTIGGQNNAFPSPSPDGKWVVFRSGRSGHKNLYVMDALEGERAGVRRLTEGPWTDTMCNWSPDGEWIAFASDRDNPGGGSFAIYFIHPNGTGLKKVVHSGEGGRTNHPWFSPDGKSLVFTSDYAAVSAEPIANPHHYQPYGDIFIARSDGSGIRRLTHNSYEDGTPSWGPMFMRPIDVVESPFGGPRCSFDDCHWLGLRPDNKAGNLGCQTRTQQASA
ncbi:PREDICTED: uncharacterized protein LOC104605872 [Nelumbo nucifera]|uniref:Uncharacterized protein LOC104605872 n=1 Tax=Nelumbo nucifera TaxID=4432 RepID=A0A1U8B0Q2_NELNU|nr:PREDICTED: uncharacterized protein LOC104605872 [Nelumbo nucifera]